MLVDANILLFAADRTSPHHAPSIRWLETVSAPIKILICIGLVAWALSHTGGFAQIMDSPSQFVAGGKKEGQFWA